MFTQIAEVGQFIANAVVLIVAMAIAFQRVRGRSESDSARITRVEADIKELWSAVNALRTTIASVDKGVAILVERTEHMMCPHRAEIEQQHK